MKTFHQSSLTFCFAVLFSMIVMVGQAYADCTNPAGTEGQQIYNTTYNAMQFCNGTNWVAMTGGVAGDNLGNHTAISDLDMGTNSITNVGGVTASGLISTTGAVIVGTQAGCAAGDAGAIRYVGGAVPYEYCDGGGTWSPFKQPACGDDDTAGCYIDTTRSNSDPEFLAENIKDGITILGITGTYTGGGGGGGDGPLYNGDHLESECIAAGGNPVEIASETVCDFTASSCPSGWTSYSNYNKTSSNYCFFSSCNCTTGSHSTWATNRETCLYSNGYSPRTGCSASKSTCYSTIISVACY